MRTYYIICEFCYSQLYKLAIVVNDKNESHLYASCNGCEGFKDFGTIEFPEGDIQEIPRENFKTGRKQEPS